MAITVPGLGLLSDDDGWLVSEPRYVAALGESCRFRLAEYDPRHEPRLVRCVDAFCSLGA